MNRFLVHRMSSRSVQGQVGHRSSVGWDCPKHNRTQSIPGSPPHTSSHPSDKQRKLSPKGPLGAELPTPPAPSHPPPCPMRNTGLSLQLGFCNSHQKIWGWLYFNTSGEETNWKSLEFGTKFYPRAPATPQAIKDRSSSRTTS